jgi:hypothetical protein
VNVVFLSPHFPPNFWNFVRGLKEAGATPLAVDSAPWEALSPGLRANLAEYYRVDDLHDRDALVRALGWLTHRRGRLDRLDSMNEYWLETEAALRDDFNVPGLRGADMARIKRKSEMKRCYQEAGVAVARGRVCRSAAELRALVAEVGYPVVAKPDVGVGAAATYKLHDEAEVGAYLAAKPPIDYIVEEFVAGDILSYDGLTDREGRVVFDASIQYGGGVMETVNDDGEMWYSLVREIPADLLEVGRRVVRAFGVRERFFHFEFFRKADGSLVALEVNMRPPGGLTVDMWNYQNDVDMYREWGNLLVDGRIRCQAARPYQVTWVGRKDRFRYAFGAAEVRARYGHLLVHHERVADVFARAIGNEGFILRSPDLEPILEAAAFIHQKA